MRGTRRYLLGLRGRLILSILLLVTLAMWLLGLVLMRQSAAQIAAQRAARGRLIAAEVSRSLDALLAGRPERLAEASRDPRVRQLLWSLGEDPEVEAARLLGPDGAVLAGGAGAADGRRGTAAELSVPVSVGGTPAGRLLLHFSAEGLRQQTLFSYLQILAQLGITSLLLVVFLVSFLSFSVVRPLRQLSAATERIADGNLDEPVPTERADEVGDLALAFNMMLLKLRQSRELNQRQLESLREAHARLLAKEQELVESEKMAAVGRVAAGVAHEVGNPLGAVTGYLALLRGGAASPEEQREYLGRIEHEVGRINRIMRDLLDWARPPRMDWSEVDLGALLRDLRAQLAAQPEFARVSLEVRTAAGLPAVRGDYHRIRQMVLNLALNAAQALPGGGTVALESLAPAAEGRAAAVRVRDDGPGIPPEIRAQLFEPFVSAGKGSRGTGLGLAICRRTAEAMGATIEVESAPGAGTTFTVSFPPPPAAPAGSV